MNTLIAGLRSLAFYLAVFTAAVRCWLLASVVAVLGAAGVAASAGGAVGTVAPVVHAKTCSASRSCFDGTLPQGPVLVAMKHESFLRGDRTPRACSLIPRCSQKQELFGIPGWGRSARIYGLIPVARDKGAKTLRAMIALAKERVA